MAKVLVDQYKLNNYFKLVYFKIWTKFVVNLKKKNHRKQEFCFV